MNVDPCVTGSREAAASVTRSITCCAHRAAPDAVFAVSIYGTRPLCRPLLVRNFGRREP
jgi:hypothetical protein